MDVNSSFGNSTSAQQMFDVPGFIAFNVIMLVGVIVPVTVLDMLIIVAFFVDKHSPLQVRLVLGNLISVGLVLLLILALEHLTALVLVTTNHPVPPREWCSFISWVLLGGNCLRLVLTATFSVVVFIMILKGVKAVNKIALAISLLVLWIVAFFALSLPLVVVDPHSVYVSGVACVPRKVEKSIIKRIVAPLCIFGLILVPLFLTIAMPIASSVYLYKHKVSASNNRAFLSAMVKLGAFLILGGIISFSGDFLPAFISLVAPTISESVLFYMIFALFNLSLWPTPILILVYMKNAWAKNAVFKKLTNLLRTAPVPQSNTTNTKSRTLSTSSTKAK